MSEFIEWRENLFQRDKVLAVSRYDSDGISVHLSNGERAVYRFSDSGSQKAALEEWRDLLIGPRPMPVLVAGGEGDDKDRWAPSSYE